MTEESRSRRPGSSLASVAHFAEIVATLGVLVTLVFLVAEVRRNTEITRTAAYDRSMETISQWRLTMAADPELTSLWTAYVLDGPRESEPSDDPRLDLLLQTLWGVYEGSYYAYQRELLGEQEWLRFHRQTCARYRFDPERWDGARQNGMVSAKLLLTDEFSSFVETSC